jgi:cytochrome c biogenesis protein CcdA/thiol-disulfide isomerase/thioredoxin
MLLLLLIGFVAGVISAVSPCVLPVLPIVLAGSAAGGPRRPYAIIAGIVSSFTAFSLSAVALLSSLGLPEDTLRNAAIVLLFVVAASLIFPQVALLLELPFARLTRRSGGDLGGGFVLGVSLGLVFVPCAGPVLAAVSVLAAQRRFGVESVLLTLVYAAGAGALLLVIAIGGQRVSTRLRANRRWFRPALGALISAGAVAILFNFDQTLQTRLGSYTSALQRHTEESTYVRHRLDRLVGRGAQTAAAKPARAGAGLPDYGQAPDLQGISAWLNTPASTSPSLGGLRGKVVLVDFWTYSCINCLRTLPHLRAWYAAYRQHGFEIVGVHTPEFAFEHVLANVRAAVQREDIRWPVAVDNSYATWTAYHNGLWPSEYLIDRRGHLRAIHLGEGGYAETGHAIRELLGGGGSGAHLPDTIPSSRTSPEIYLGPVRFDRSRYVGSRLVTGRQATFTFARAIPENAISFAGPWTLKSDSATAGQGGRLRLRFHAKDIYLVVGGSGKITAFLDRKPVGAIEINSARLYRVFAAPTSRRGLVELRFTAGLKAYSLTFG